MSIQDLGSIGELVAAFATIATLLYLARQIHQNTKSVQSSNYSAWIDATNATHNIVYQNAAIHGDAVNDTRELTDEEQWKFHFQAVQWFYALEAAFLWFQNGTVDHEYFESRMRAVKRSMAFPGYRRWWQEWAQHLYDARFVAHVEKIVSSQEP